MQTTCLFCGNTVQLIYVHGHYQCAACKTNALPCCDGDHWNNSFLTEVEKADKQDSTSDNIHGQQYTST